MRRVLFDRLQGSTAKRLLPLAYSLVAVMLFVLLLAWIALRVELALAGFLNGQSIWSNAQKQTAIDLLAYAASGSEADYADFRLHYAVLEAYRSVRDKVASGHFDAHRIEAKLRRSHAPLVAIPDIIFTFRYAVHVPYMRRALDLWRSTDAAVSKMGAVADQLHAAYAAGPIVNGELISAVDRIQALNDRIGPLSRRFSMTLASGSVAFTRAVFAGVIFLACVALLLWLWLAHRVLTRMRGSEDRYRLLFDSAPDAIVMVDEGSGLILDANRTAGAWAGCDPQALRAVRYVDLFLSGNGSPRCGDSARGVIRGENGRTRPVEVQSNIAVWDGQTVRQAILRDVSEREASERERRVAADALASISEGVVIADSQRRVVSANAAALRLIGFTEQNLVGTRLEEVRSLADGGPLPQVMWEELAASHYWSGEVRCRRADGSLYDERLGISTIADPNGQVQHYVAVFDDISEVNANRRRLQHMASHDALTGLVNRLEFQHQCEIAIRHADHGQGILVVMFVDLNGFKAINDLYGHAVGDRLLELVGKRIVGQLREGAVASRMGGDEFTVLLFGLTTREEAAPLADRMLAALSAPFILDDQEIVVGASIGIAGYPQDAVDAKTLIANADAAMYTAKSARRNSYRLYAAVERGKVRQGLVSG